MSLVSEICDALPRLEAWQLQAVSELVSEFLYETEEREQEPEAAAGDVEIETREGPSGWIELKYISRGGKRWGPYEYLRWREGPVTKSRYLGKVKSS